MERGRLTGGWSMLLVRGAIGTVFAILAVERIAVGLPVDHTLSGPAHPGPSPA